MSVASLRVLQAAVRRHGGPDRLRSGSVGIVDLMDVVPQGGRRWLLGIFGSVLCATCGTPYAREDVTVVGNRDDYWYLRCHCGKCGVQGVGVVIVKTVEPPKPDERPALSADDVLAAHELLRRYHGDLVGLFR